MLHVEIRNDCYEIHSKSPISHMVGRTNIHIARQPSFSNTCSWKKVLIFFFIYFHFITD